ncbi:MAG: polyamine aminopropyltransferase, partial [Planctomycetaceae bacterium]
YLLRPLLSSRGLPGLRGRACLVLGLLVMALIKADSLTRLAEEGTLGADVVHAESTPYQRIVLTRDPRGFQLFLNGHLQFNSVDEYRYHEALVHPALAPLKNPRRMLVLGGGDGLAVREILRYRSVESVTLVDLDPGMTTLAERFPPLRELSGDSLRDARVRVINQDAFVWVGQPATELFDAAIVDFPDPGNFAVGKLYTRRFFTQLRAHLSPSARVAVQCTSPLVAPRSFWCVVATLEAAGFEVRPYQASVPTFGIWGFALATTQPAEGELKLPADVAGSLRFLTDAGLAELFVLPRDLGRVPVEVNQLNNQALVRYYDEEWGAWR